MVNKFPPFLSFLISPSSLFTGSNTNKHGRCLVGGGVCATVKKMKCRWQKERKVRHGRKDADHVRNYQMMWKWGGSGWRKLQPARTVALGWPWWWNLKVWKMQEYDFGWKEDSHPVWSSSLNRSLSQWKISKHECRWIQWKTSCFSKDVLFNNCIKDNG